MSAILVRGLVQRYGKFVAVDHLDLDVPDGAVFGLIGPNGAGKTTTMLCLATLLKPNEGTITVFGFDPVTQPRQVRRAVGWMPDFFGLYDGLTCAEYLDFFAAAYGLGPAARKRRVDDLLELVELPGKRDVDVAGLSRGMQQRLGLARTLVHDPALLILDEPASGLDPRARLEVKALLKELRSMGKTILISSHILTELADCCTSIGIIERGQLLLHGPIETVYRLIQRNRQIEVRFAGNPEAGVSLIRSDPKVRDVQMDTRSCTVEIDGQDADVQRLLRQLVAADCGLIGFAEKEPTLEDVFMLVTKGLVT